MNTKDSGHFNAHFTVGMGREEKESHGYLMPSLKTNCFSAVFFHHWFACNQMKTLPHNKSTCLTCGMKSGSSDPVMKLSVGLHECGELGNRLVLREQ